MSMFPHTITVYNVSTETDITTFEDVTTVNITVLHGVLLDASKAVNVRTSGLVGADAVNLYVPFGVKATGPDGAEKTYCGPLEYWALADKSKNYTFSVGVAGADTTNHFSYFVKGEVIEPDLTFEQMGLKYDDVYTMTSIDEKDFGGLKHFEIGGS